MRAISLDHAANGMILGKNIYTADGRVLLRQGSTLNERYLKALKDLKFTHIYIRDTRLPDVELNDVIPEEVRMEAIQLISKSFGDASAQMSGKNAVAPNKVGFNIDGVVDVTRNIVASIMGNKDLVLQMADLKSLDNYTFAHSVNVCVVGTVMGHRLGLPEAKLKDLATGLMLHDVGRTTIPPEIMDKPGKLTEAEFEKMKEHARNGFDMLREIFSLSAHSKIVVLQHHERYDGTGYPKGLKGSEIHLYGQIGAISDVYDALTSDRPYRKRFLPHEAIEFLIGHGDRYFSMELVTTFVSSIAPYPVGTMVKLSNGYTGLVTDVDMQFASRPTVHLVKDPNGKDLEAPLQVLELKRERSIAITKVMAE